VKKNVMQALWHKKSGCQMLARTVLEKAESYEEAV